MELLLEKNSKVRIVINCIALESVSEALECLKTLPVTDTEIVQNDCEQIKNSRQISHDDGRKPHLYYFLYGKLSAERIEL